MQIVHQIFGESLLQALGWTFIHPLWQIGVVAVLLAMARLLMQRSAPRYRHLAGNLALGVICAAAAVTFWLLLDPQIKSAANEKIAATTSQ